MAKQAGKDELNLYDYQTIQLIWKRLNELEKKVDHLQKDNHKLQETIQSMKPIHIERIEYKIHELTIDTLSGTLNVGLTANADEEGVGEVIEQIIEKQKENILEDLDPSLSPQTSPEEKTKENEN